MLRTELHLPWHTIPLILCDMPSSLVSAKEVSNSSARREPQSVFYLAILLVGRRYLGYEYQQNSFPDTKFSEFLMLCHDTIN